MRALRALAWLACVGACAGQHLTKPSPRAAKEDGSCAKCECLDGYFAPAKSDELCKPCDPGTFRSGEMETCEQCKVGEYSFKGWGTCQPCGPGRQPDEDRTTCTSCDPGTFKDYDMLKCLPCEGINEFSFAGSASCDVCPVGSIANEARDDCIVCSINTAANFGATICTECPLGKFSSDSRDACVSCAAGTKRGKGDDFCIECRDNKLSLPGSPECDLCLKDFYRDGDECKPCKSGMVCDQPGVTIENVRLEKNHWRTSAESAKIETCPLKKSCRSTKPRPDVNASVADGGSVARRLEESAPAGGCVDDLTTTDTVGDDCSWYDGNPGDCGGFDDEDFTAREQCCACGGGGTAAPTLVPDISVDAGEALCTKGHEGPLCAVCKRHYYRLGQECVKCRRSTIAFTVIGILVGIVIFLAFFLMAMSYSNVVAKGVGKSFEKTQEESEISLSRQGSTYFARADSAVQTTDRPDPADTGSGLKGWLFEGEAPEALRRNVTTFVKQLSGTYSIFVNLPWVFDIKFPNIYERVLERLGLINVDMSFSLECVISRKVTFQDRLLAATIGPMVAILLVNVIGLGVLYLGFKRNEHKHRKDRKRTTIMVIAQLVLLILFLSYTSTSTTIFRAFRQCDDLGEPYHGSNRYMHDDYSVSCKSSRYIFIVTWAALMLLVYPIGIPLVSFCLMWRHQEKLNPKVDSEFIDRDIKFETVGESESAFRQACVEKKTQLRSKAVAAKEQDRELVSAAQLFHFMYDNYEPQYWWFECFDYIRRLALTGLMVVILPGSALQGFIGVLIALGGLLAYNTFKPFAEDASDYLAMAAQLSTFFVFLSALMIQVDAVYHRNGFGVLLTVVTFIPPFISLCCALHAFHSTKRSLPKLGSNKDSASKAPAPAKDDVADPESSPTSPLARNAPPQEDEEAPAAPAKS